jgi:hypothetical protein
MPHGSTPPDSLPPSPIRFRTAYSVTNSNSFLLFGTASNEPAKPAVFIAFTYHAVRLYLLFNNNKKEKHEDAAQYCEPEE